MNCQFPNSFCSCNFCPYKLPMDTGFLGPESQSKKFCHKEWVWEGVLWDGLTILTRSGNPVYGLIVPLEEPGLCVGPLLGWAMCKAWPGVGFLFHEAQSSDIGSHIRPGYVKGRPQENEKHITKRKTGHECLCHCLARIWEGIFFKWAVESPKIPEKEGT